jgi:arsenite oxidase small subunit
LEERISREKFIRLGAAIGVTAAGASVVAACGGSGGESGATSPSGSSETTASEATGGGATEAASSGGQVIAQASEVPQNSAMPFTNSGQPAVLVHLQGGDFVAYSAVCTHQQCEVAYQQQSSQLVCPCHGSIFDPASNGQVVSGPAQQPLPEIPVEVQGGQITKA